MIDTDRETRRQREVDLKRGRERKKNEKEKSRSKKTGKAADILTLTAHYRSNERQAPSSN